MGEVFPALHPATTVLQDTVLISLEAAFPIWLGENTTAAEQS